MELLMKISSPFFLSDNDHELKQTPDCYKTQRELSDQAVKHLKIPSLMYMFYNIINQDYQMKASEELISRGWAYSAKQNKWICKSPQEIEKCLKN